MGLGPISLLRFKFSFNTLDKFFIRDQIELFTMEGFWGVSLNWVWVLMVLWSWANNFLLLKLGDNICMAWYN